MKEAYLLRDLDIWVHPNIKRNCIARSSPKKPPGNLLFRRKCEFSLATYNVEAIVLRSRKVVTSNKFTQVMFCPPSSASKVYAKSLK